MNYSIIKISDIPEFQLLDLRNINFETGSYKIIHTGNPYNCLMIMGGLDYGLSMREIEEILNG